MSLLCNEGFEVYLESSGALSVAQVDRRVAIVLDLKTSSSGESHWNDWNNPSAIFREDQIKFVICDEQDYVWVKANMLDDNLVERAGGIFFFFLRATNPQTVGAMEFRRPTACSHAVAAPKKLWRSEPGRRTS